MIVAKAVGLAFGFVILACLALPATAQTPARPDGHGRDKLDDYNRALGVECSHCHVQDQWADDSVPAKAQARKMVEMVQVLNTKHLRGIGEVSCSTCHAGETQPSRLPQDAMDAQLAKWPESIASAHESTKLTMAVYSASTGLRCGQCHDVTNWKRMENDRMRMVKRMLPLFSAMQPYMPPTARTQCYTCHKGSNKPQKDPPRG
jgi:hypothetical protein